MKKPINRRSFLKRFTGLLGAGLVPMVGNNNDGIYFARDIPLITYDNEPEKPITIEQLRACRDDMKKSKMRWTDSVQYDEEEFKRIFEIINNWSRNEPA